MNQSPTELPPVLTLLESAQYLRRCTRTVRRRIKAGELRSYKEGQEHRIRREWLLEYEQRLIDGGE
ncbi:helix-turn-helix domain-containing protein [Paenibacillus sp. GCM10027626]|uniref:helix-turn-helix domain-containing protein n=1 Tax=Paenibacillus sp. GCM10027626 TaxID=3273411 RepID=UPI00362E9D95